MTNNVTQSRLKLLIYFLKLGAFRFGGPLVIVESMHKDLVGEDKSFSENDYRLGLALSQLAPGPLATQLVAFFGWSVGGFWLGLAALIAFVLPAFLMMIALGHIYMSSTDHAWLKVLSVGAAPVVIALVIRSGWNLFRKTDFRRPSQKLIFLASLLVTVVYKQEVVWVFLVAAFLPSLLRGKFQNWAILLPTANIQWDKLWELFKYFFEIGAVVFGSGLVIVPFLYGGVVLQHQWLTESQFVDAMAMGMMTPGPIVITVAFVGYIVNGFSGALASAIGIFLPCFLFVVIPAPFFKKFLNAHPEIQTSIDGMAVAALGAIFGGAVLLVQKNLTEWPSRFAAIALILLSIYFKKIPDPIWVILSLVTAWIFTGPVG